jgi:mono/diheme cytochrome c family protein
MAKEPYDLRRHLPSVTFTLLVLLVVGALGGVIVYTGVYDIGADAPHSKPVYWLLNSVRQRSIAVRAQSIVVPRDLSDASRISRGAGLYADMCTGCHLAPGMERTEISQGLYPPAPELARVASRSAKEQFWIIKHGVKLTAMAAWGHTHSDDLIWDMVAFVQKLPRLTPEQYQALVKSAPEDHEQMMHDMPNMPGMAIKPAPAGDEH